MLVDRLCPSLASNANGTETAVKITRSNRQRAFDSAGALPSSLARRLSARAGLEGETCSAAASVEVSIAL